MKKSDSFAPSTYMDMCQKSGTVKNGVGLPVDVSLNQTPGNSHLHQLPHPFQDVEVLQNRLQENLHRSPGLVGLDLDVFFGGCLFSLA